MTPPLLVALNQSVAIQSDGLGQPASLVSGQSILTATVVVLVLAAAAWALMRSNSMRRAQLPIVVETAVALGDRRSLVVVSVEGRRLLLGLTPQHVNLVTELKTPAASFDAALDSTLSTPPA
jgi:flagellar biogenesis protein FliO